MRTYDFEGKELSDRDDIIFDLYRCASSAVVWNPDETPGGTRKGDGGN